jgi:hypothetical protein
LAITPVTWQTAQAGALHLCEFCELGGNLVKERGKVVQREFVQRSVVHWALVVALVAGVTAGAQTTYQPKFKGDPAKSESEAAALGYMRTVLRAQKQYKKKNDKFAASLADLVHTGSFTKRMVNPNRGDYSVGFKPNKDGFDLTMTPQQLDAEHRSFYAAEDGVIHGDDQGPANEKSPVVK